MRPSFGGLVVGIVALGACSQQLGAGPGAIGRGGPGGRLGGSAAGGTGAPPGDGGSSINGIGAGTGAGTGTGTGGIDGWSTSDAGGLGGADGTTSCDSFVAQYEAALSEAQACGVGATGQCAQVVPAHLSVCNSCPTYVNDATKPLAIAAAWQQAGCSPTGAGQPCSELLCPAPTNKACVDVGDGSGRCSFGAGTDGGLSLCGSLDTQYQALLARAQVCTVGAANQCAQTVPLDLSPCSKDCLAHVNDASELSLIKSQWDSLDCDNTVSSCDVAGCPQVVSAACVAADGGAGSCEQIAFAFASGG